MTRVRFGSGPELRQLLRSHDASTMAVFGADRHRDGADFASRMRVSGVFEGMLPYAAGVVIANRSVPLIRESEPQKAVVTVSRAERGDSVRVQTAFIYGHNEYMSIKKARLGYNLEEISLGLPFEGKEQMSHAIVHSTYVFKHPVPKDKVEDAAMERLKKGISDGLSKLAQLEVEVVQLSD